MPLYTFDDLTRRDATASYVLLSDGRFYRLRVGLASLPVASSVRMVDLSQRLAAFETDEGLEITQLSQTLLAEMAGLFFEDAPREALAGHAPMELLAFIEQGQGEPESPGKRSGTNDDLGFAVMRVADRLKLDPAVIEQTWPAWRLNATIEGLERLEAIESMQTAEAVSVGNGNGTSQGLRSTQRRWRAEARGASKDNSPVSAQQFMMMMNGGRMYL